MGTDGQRQEPDARSVADRALTIATALLLTSELLFFVALFAFLIRLIEETR